VIGKSFGVGWQVVFHSKQAKVRKYGYATEVSFVEASATIDALAKNGWVHPVAAPLAIGAMCRPLWHEFRTGTSSGRGARRSGMELKCIIPATRCVG